MEVDSEGLPSMISNGDDDGLPPLCQSHHEDDDDDGDFPMPEQSTSPKQHVRASRQRKGGDKLRQGWTASRKQPGGGRTVPVPGIAFVPNLRSPMAPSTPEAAAAGSLQGGEGERPSGEEEEEEEDRGKPGPRELDDPEPRAQQQQGEQEEEEEQKEEGQEGENAKAVDGEMAAAAEDQERPWRKPDGTTTRAILSVAADDAPLGSLAAAAAASKQRQQPSSARPFSSRHRVHLGAAGLSPGGVDAETGAGVSLEEAWRRAREDAAQSFRDCESILARGNDSQKAPEEQQMAGQEVREEENKEGIEAVKDINMKEEGKEEEVKDMDGKEEKEVEDDNEGCDEGVKLPEGREVESSSGMQEEEDDEEEEEAPGAAYESDCSTVSTASGLRSLDSWAGEGGGSVASDVMLPRGDSFSRQQRQQQKEEEGGEEEEDCRPTAAAATAAAAPFDSSPSDLHEDAEEARSASKVPRLRMIKLSQESGVLDNKEEEEEEQEGEDKGKNGEEGPPRGPLSPPRGLLLPPLSVPSPQDSPSTPSPHGPDLSAYAGLNLLDGSQRRGSMDTDTRAGLEATLHPGALTRGLLLNRNEEEEEQEEGRGGWGHSGSPLQPPRALPAPLPGVRAEPPLPMLEPENSLGGMSSSAFHSSDSEEDDDDDDDDEEEEGGGSEAMDWLPPQSPEQPRQHQRQQLGEEDETETAPPQEAPLLRQQRSWRISVQSPMQHHGGDEGGEEALRGGGSRGGAESSSISPSTSADGGSSPEAQLLPARDLIVLPGAPRPEGKQEEEDEEGEGALAEPVSLGLYHRSLVQGVHELIAGTVAELKISTQAEVARVLGDVAQVSSAMKAAIQDRKRQEDEERQRKSSAALGYHEGSLLESITSVLQEELESRGLSAEGVAEAARAAVSEPLRLFAQELQQGNRQQQQQQQLLLPILEMDPRSQRELAADVVAALRPALDEEVAQLRGGVEAAGRELREAARELQLLRGPQGDQQQQQQLQQQRLSAVLEGVASREREVLRALEEGAGQAEAHGAALLEVADGLRRREDGIRDAVELRLQETAAALRGLQETVAELRQSISDPKEDKVGAREAPRVHTAPPPAVRFAAEQLGCEGCSCRQSLSVERGVERASELLEGSAEILGSAAPVHGGIPEQLSAYAPVHAGIPEQLPAYAPGGPLAPAVGGSGGVADEEQGQQIPLLFDSADLVPYGGAVALADKPALEQDVDLQKSLERTTGRLKADDNADEEDEDDIDLRKSLERRKERLKAGDNAHEEDEDDIDVRKSLERRKERLKADNGEEDDDDIDLQKSLERRKERMEAREEEEEDDDVDLRKSLDMRKERLDESSRRSSASGSEDIDLRKSLDMRKERLKVDEDCGDDEEEDIDMRKSLERRRERLKVDDDDDDSDSESGLSPGLRRKAARMRGSAVMPPSTAAERTPWWQHADEGASSSSDEDEELLSIGPGSLRRRSTAASRGSNVPTPASHAAPRAASSSSQEEDSSSDDEDVSASLRRKAARLQQRQMAEEAGSSSDEDEDFELSAAGRLQRTRWRTPAPA